MREAALDIVRRDISESISLRRSMLVWVIPAAAGTLALGTSTKVYQIYLDRRKLHHIFWAIGLTFWGLSDFTQAYALVFGWSVFIYKLYYFSAISLVGLLGVGASYLRNI